MANRPAPVAAVLPNRRTSSGPRESPRPEGAASPASQQHSQLHPQHAQQSQQQQQQQQPRSSTGAEGYDSPSSSQQRTKQQTSSRMMKTTRRGRPYAKDTHDLFATLIVSLQLTSHRMMFKTYPNSFTTDEAAENLSALKFSQSNRAPDPREPSRVVTTTTTTTFSMNRDMAKGICQHFMDARLIENAADPSHGIFKEKGVYQLTPKGLHILERFITKNGINGEHLLTVFSSQPICMKLLHLERRAHDDELLINRPIIEVVFRRFAGRQANYLPGTGGDSGGKDVDPASFDRTLGIGMSDIVDKSAKGPTKGPVKIKHTFPAVSALDWLCDFSTICGRDEAAEVAAHFQRLGLIELVRESSKKDMDEDSTIIVSGEDGIGRVSRGEFKCHYKAIYGMTDRGRGVARWPGYTSLPEKTTATGVGFGAPLGRETPTSEGQAQLQQQSRPYVQDPQQDETESIDSGNGESNRGGSRTRYSSRASSAQDVPGIPDRRGGVHHSSRRSTESGSVGSLASGGGVPELEGRMSAAERLRNEYLTRDSSSGSGAHHEGDGGAMSAHYARDSNSNRLRQVLEEPALRSLFRDFLKQNFCEENLSFWLDVQDFKRRFHTTSSAVAVRPGGSSGGGGSSSGDKSSGGKRGLFGRSGGSDKSKEQQGQGFTAMEKHQQDLIAMAFVIYNTYLAPASPCELNIEHSLRTELVTYMNKVLYDAKTSSGGDGVTTVRAQDINSPNANGISGSASHVAGLSSSRGATSGSASGDTTNPGAVAVPFAMSSPGEGLPQSTSTSVDERKSTVSATLPRAPLHASQLQTIVRLYERIQDHTFRLMATDSVPRFIRDARFLGLVRSVEEYTEALESGRLDPNDVSGPVISRAVVDAMDLPGSGGAYGSAGGQPMAI
ncbi:regulator of G protein signaling superfamily [Microstroma glucosiphilum]|uniref:Regulator of G protein signaling superfamily n=1 Tax=Pseudomicrostroma glucosiphilum TaxID=1684307 RepID=A0A316U3C5_9BASI|nr:regulator of G protein signaling superfamily [Pseudomicrostroma glucosiphilum]PWN18981.1 regulator of G protein signaling superfamily [Pseudomicrostroma glucosiphilum]